MRKRRSVAVKEGAGTSGKLAKELAYSFDECKELRWGNMVDDD